MKPPRVQPTRQQLQAAFARLQRPGWPADLDSALADRTCCPLVQGMARAIVRRALQEAFTPQRPAPRTGLRVHRIPKAQPFDARRAAANDLDD